VTLAILHWPGWALAVFLYVIVQRLAELAYAHSNTKRLLGEGGQEYGRRHYPLFILLHGGWLLALALSGRPPLLPSLALLALFILSQIFRFWTLASIGRWWTTRIISAPHFPRIRNGPYRFMAHPNYAVVVAEIALLPLLLAAPSVALVFSLANALLLAWRIRIEATILLERRTG
jgi:methyltransferase